jgi:uncharacterized membrane protein YciS (DUF1049 family)
MATGKQLTHWSGLMTSLKKLLLALLLAIVFILVLIGVTDNSSLVALTFIDYSTPQWPIAWWVLIAFAMGVLLGYLIGFGGNVKTRIEVMKSRRELQKSNQRLEQLQQTAEQ